MGVKTTNNLFSHNYNQQRQILSYATGLAFEQIMEGIKMTD